MGYFNATTTSTDYPKIDMDRLLRIAKQIRETRKKFEQTLTKVVEEPCPICGRKPTIAHRGTIIVCPHIWSTLKKISRLVEPVSPLERLTGIQFEVFDYGPVRW